VERKSLYIDATVATAEDFNFLKALKLNLRIWTDTALFHGLTYDQGVATDHFFRDSLASMADRLQDRDNVIISMKRSAGRSSMTSIRTSTSSSIWTACALARNDIGSTGSSARTWCFWRP